ncbi:MAG: hypothetical protein ACKN9D_10035 [Actinomycetales bacterium]
MSRQSAKKPSLRTSARHQLLIALTLGAALTATACTGQSSSEQSNSPSAAASQTAGPTRGPNPDVTAEQQVLLDELLATPLPVDDVQQRIKAAGYTSRIVEIDGEPQPATMDYRLDRVNLITTNSLVTDAFWG